MKTALGALEWSAPQFWCASMSEFFAACEGFAEAKGLGPKTSMSRERLDDLMEQYPDG